MHLINEFSAMENIHESCKVWLPLILIRMRHNRRHRTFKRARGRARDWIEKLLHRISCDYFTHQKYENNCVESAFKWARCSECDKQKQPHSEIMLWIIRVDGYPFHRHQPNFQAQWIHKMDPIVLAFWVYHHTIHVCLERNSFAIFVCDMQPSSSVSYAFKWQ